jgi:hypothetical protein
VADDQHVPGTCRSDQQCRDHDGRTACPTSRPLCDACLEAAGPGIRGLVFDYLDLAQVCPTGIEDAHVPVAGWEAIHHLQDLHRRCRSILGRTRRLLSLHGTCPKRSCGAQALYRLEPESFKDEPPVWCDACKASRTYAEYEWFMAHLKWPPHEDDELEDAGAQQVAA